MIKLNDNIYVQEPKDVRAIRPLYMPDPQDTNAYIPNPNKCMVLIGDGWIEIRDKGAAEIANILQNAEDDLS